VVTMKNDSFWDGMPCGSCKVLTGAAQRNIPEDTILNKLAIYALRPILQIVQLL
jgi:hypothetical protein